VRARARVRCTFHCNERLCRAKLDRWITQSFYFYFAVRAMDGFQAPKGKYQCPRLHVLQRQPMSSKNTLPKNQNNDSTIRLSEERSYQRQVLMWQEEDQVAAAASLLLAVSATLQPVWRTSKNRSQQQPQMVYLAEEAEQLLLKNENEATATAAKLQPP
jgi:hypothetical protein